MCLWLRWEIWETVIVGKCLEMTEIDWETDKIRILGSWEPLRTVTSLKEWRAMLIPETWLIRGMQPCPSLLFQWKGVGASGEGPGLRASLPINPASLPLGLLCTVKKDPILTRGSSVQIQFSSFLSLSRVWLFGTPWTAAHQASPSPALSIRVFSNESVLHIKWPKYWSFSFSIIPSNEYSGLISFRIDFFDLLAVQGTFKSLLQHHS